MGWAVGVCIFNGKELFLMKEIFMLTCDLLSWMLWSKREREKEREGAEIKVFRRANFAVMNRLVNQTQFFSAIYFLFFLFELHSSISEMVIFHCYE